MSRNVFFTKFSELSGERFDPNTYHYERLQAILKLKNSSFSLKKLKYITKLDKLIVTSNDNNLPYIGLTNIESNTGVCIKGIEKETFSSAIQFKKGQVLFSKLRPYLNKVYFADFDGLCSTEFHIFDSAIINNKYLSIFLQTNIVVSQTKHLMSGNTLPRLQTEDIENLLIPILSDSVQNKIILIIEEAHRLKAQKEKEAQRKLDSIDTYLLNELGIVTPLNQKENLNNKISFIKFSNISGQRLDPLYYSGEISGFFKMIKFPLQNLSLFVKYIDSGIGAGKQDQVDKNNGLLQLRPTNFDKYGQLIFRRNIYISQDIKYPRVNVNDVLFNNTNSQELVGKTTIISDDLKASFSNHITRIKVNHDINPKFLWIILNLYQKQKIFYNLCTNWNNQSGIGLDILKDLKIPVLPMNHQDRIINKVQNLHKEAKCLKIEAKKIYEDSKKEVEKMILGDD